MCVLSLSLSALLLCTLRSLCAHRVRDHSGQCTLDSALAVALIPLCHPHCKHDHETPRHFVCTKYICALSSQHSAQEVKISRRSGNIVLLFSLARSSINHLSIRSETLFTRLEYVLLNYVYMMRWRGAGGGGLTRVFLLSLSRASRPRSTHAPTHTPRGTRAVGGAWAVEGSRRPPALLFRAASAGGGPPGTAEARRRRGGGGG